MNVEYHWSASASDRNERRIKCWAKAAASVKKIFTFASIF